MAAVNIEFPGNLAQVDTAEDLRRVPSEVLSTAILSLVVDLASVFKYDSGSFAVDDGTTVLRPFDKTPLQAGRWLFTAEGLAPGRPGDTGPANSTYTTLAALKAAPATNRSYILAQADAPPATFGYVEGDFTGRTDVVKLDAVPLATGALVNTNTKRGLFATDTPYGAKIDGVTNDSAAITASINQQDILLLGPGNLKTDTSLPQYFNAVAFKTEFSGSQRLNKNIPQFGGQLQTFAVGGQNSLVGIAHNNRPAGTLAFPTGVTGYGRNDSAGNTVFGIFGRADQYGAAGCVTNEVNSFNWSATPASDALPPDRSFGTAQQQPIAFTVGAGGSLGSSIAIHITREGEAPQSFLTGIYMSANAIERYGIFIDAEENDTFTSAAFKFGTNGIGIQLTAVGTYAPFNAAIAVNDGTNVTRWAVKQSGIQSVTSIITRTTVGAAGAAQVLPSNPTGYKLEEIDGIVVKFPYYQN